LEFVEQGGFPDAGLPGDEDDLTPAFQRLPERLAQRSEWRPPANQFHGRRVTWVDISGVGVDRCLTDRSDEPVAPSEQSLNENTALRPLP